VWARSTPTPGDARGDDPLPEGGGGRRRVCHPVPGSTRGRVLPAVEVHELNHTSGKGGVMAAREWLVPGECRVDDNVTGVAGTRWDKRHGRLSPPIEAKCV